MAVLPNTVPSTAKAGIWLLPLHGPGPVRRMHVARASLARSPGRAACLQTGCGDLAAPLAARFPHRTNLGDDVRISLDDVRFDQQALRRLAARGRGQLRRH
jgi:hypothetical protein